MIHRRTTSNVISTIIVLAVVGAGLYFLVPIIGKWMSDSMGHRETMHRPSSVGVRDQLPNK